MAASLILILKASRPPEVLVILKVICPDLYCQRMSGALTRIFSDIGRKSRDDPNRGNGEEYVAFVEISTLALTIFDH